MIDANGSRARILIPDGGTAIPDGAPYVTISAVKTLLARPFDKERVAAICEEKGRKDPGYKYAGMAKDEIIAAWEAKAARSAAYGRLLDEYSGRVITGDKAGRELFLLDNDPESDPALAARVRAFDSFWARLAGSADGVVPVAREMDVALATPDGYVKGRLDFLAYNKRRNRLVVIDWKTDKSIETERGRWTDSLLGPMKDYPALSWWTYTLQVQFYKMALLNGGYVRPGSVDGIDTMIVNFPEEPYDVPEELMGAGEPWSAFGPAIPYDEGLLGRVFAFALKKDALLRKSAAPQ